MSEAVEAGLRLEQRPVQAGWLMLPARAVPQGDAWLSADERELQATLRFPARRRDWRLGRFAGKCALRGGRGPDEALASLSILPDLDGAPVASVAGGRVGGSLSLSHRDGWALAVVASSGELGCDLEVIESRSRAFVDGYFTAAERRLVADATPERRDTIANLVWSAKESALKLRKTGLRVDTRELEVGLPSKAGIERDGAWHPLRVATWHGSPLEGWWRKEQQLLATVVTSRPGPAPRPISLRGSPSRPPSPAPWA